MPKTNAFWNADPEQRSTASRHIAAFGTVLVATLLRYWANPILGSSTPWILYFPAVLLAAWYGGGRAGALATVVSVALGRFLWVEPRFAFGQINVAAGLSITLFAVSGLAISYISEMWHRALRAEARAKRDLEQKLEERTQALKASFADMEAFSYTVSHDLRAPLRSINGFADVILEDHGAAIPQAAREHLMRMKNAARRMDSLIVGVLDFSRLGRQEVKLEQVELDPLVDEIIGQYPQLSQPHVHIDVVKPLGQVCAMRPMLVQCISNLLTNSAKFIAPGAKANIKVWSERSDGVVRLFFQDDGIGMDEQFADKIFLPFHRLNETCHYEGTGIGLSIVKKAVERMGGKVSVKSKLGEGTTFCLQFPERQKLENSH